MKKPAVAAIAALAITFAGRLLQSMMLRRASAGLSFGSALLLLLLFVLLCAGILAVFAYLFATIGQNTGGFSPTFKRLSKVFVLFLAAGVVMALLLGLVATMLGRWTQPDTAKGIADWTSNGFAVLLIPVGLHAFFSAGLYQQDFLASFKTLKPMYFLILGICAATAGIGRLLGIFSLPAWAVALTTYVLQFSVLLVFLHLYQRQPKPKKVPAKQEAAQ